MAPTLVTACTALPPEGAELRLGRPGASFMTHTLVTSCTTLPPEGAELRLGRPGASFIAPTLVASRTTLPPEGADVNGKPLLFCGDTLFSGGCGRLFEGTPAQMLASLDKLAALPGATLVCCAHEYTLSNLRFALAVEPDNAELAAYHARCLRLRADGHPTLPSSIAQELLVNPFLRTRQATIMAAAHRFDASAHDITAFAAIRQWKNEFK